MKRASLIAAVTLIVLALAGCSIFGIGVDKVIGKWQIASVVEKEFKSDGTMTTTLAATLATTGTWAHSGSNLTQTTAGIATTTTVTFSADNNTMTLGSPVGLSYTRE
jgi:hypothetical protein